MLRDFGKILIYFSGGRHITPTGLYSDRSLFRQVFIPTGRYSDRSLFRQYRNNGPNLPRKSALFRQVNIPTGRYSYKSLFGITTQITCEIARYSDRSLFRQVFIPTSRYPDKYRGSIIPTFLLFRQVFIPTGLYSDRSLFRQV